MSTPRPKNIIWFTTDHMRYDCIGAHGNAAMHTPNLDALVAGGVSFDHCYANSPVCMPSRCSFMTGCYPQQTGVMSNGQELDPDFPCTVARQFGAGGYTTAQIGKLHFQSHEDEDLTPRPKDSYGFDRFYLAEEPGCYEDAYRTWLRGERPDLVETFTVPRSLSPERASERRHFRVLDAPWQYSFSGWVGTQVTRYLGGRRHGQFIHAGFYAPHPPLNPTAEMMAPYVGVDLPPVIPRTSNRPGFRQADLTDEEFKGYQRHFYAMITGVDMAIGMVIDHLKRRGDYEDTLLIFGSDHGDLMGDHGGLGKNACWFDGVMRLPWILHWPNGLGTEARRIDGLVEMVDVLPTLLGLSGAPVHQMLAGRDYSQALLRGDELVTRDEVYAVHRGGASMIRTHDWKYCRYQGADSVDEVLYDLNQDPDECTDVASYQAQALREMRDRCLFRSVDASESRRVAHHHF